MNKRTAKAIAQAIFVDYSGRRGFGLNGLNTDDRCVFRRLLEQQAELILAMVNGEKKP